MFDKRLLALVSSARKYIAANVMLQWFALVANILLMVSVGVFLQGLLAGGTDAPHVGGIGNADDASPLDGSFGRLFSFAASLPGIVVVAVAAILVRFACLRGAQLMGLKAAGEAKRTVRQLVYDKLVRLGPSYTEHVATSEAVQVSVEGTEQLESYFGSYLPQLFYALAAPLTLFLCLAPLSLPAAVVLLVCVPLIPLSIVAVQTIAKRVMKRYWGAYTDLGSAFLENLQGLTTLKIYQADEARHKAMNEEAEGFRRATMRLLRMQLNSVTIMDFFAFGGAAAGIIAVLVQFAGGNATFAAAFAIIFLSAEFFIPMRTLGSFFHTAMNGMAAAEKMFDLLAVPEPAVGTRAVDPANADIECADVSYSYDGERTVLSRVDFRAPAGSFTAIVGESGSGKSTLAGILSGRNAGYAGKVRIGGIDLAQISRASLMATVTTVSFSSYLFKGTVRSNLLLGRPHASEADLWDVLETCRLADFVRASGGLDMPLTEQGSNLSGGQRQRLALARALLHNTPVYLFDEATSNIDAESERAIVEVIHKLARTKTVVMISHRLAAVCNADRVCALADGRVAEAGTHEELLAKGGVYARLWNQQTELERFVRLGGGKGKSEEAKGSEAPSDAEREAASSAEDALWLHEVESARAAAMRADAETAATEKEGSADSAFSAFDQSATALSGPPHRSNLSVMLRLVRLVKPLAPFMAFAVVLGVAGFAAAILLTVLGLHGLLAAARLTQGLALGTACAFVAVCGIVRGPLRYGEQICNHFIAFKLLALVRDKVFGALRTLAPAKLEGRDKGNLVALVTSDIELLEVFYAHTVSPVAIAAIVSVAATAFIAWLSPVLGLLAAAAYLAIGVAMPVAASKASGDAGRAFRDGIGDMNTFVLDSLRGLRETLQFGCERERSGELASRMRGLSHVEARLKGKTASFMSLTSALVLFFDVAMLLAAAGLYMTGGVDFASAVMATGALTSSFGPVIAVANLGSTLQQTLASGARVLDLLDEQPQTREVTDGRELAEFTGAAAHHVDFSYGSKRVLEDVDLRIEPGAIVLLAGKSGSGKSTLCKLFMRFWDATRGIIEISGDDIRRVNTVSLRQIEGYMTQETHLFAGTIRDNIMLARPNATEEELARACEKAAIADFIARLPQGFDTPVGELGDTLSGGERQRIGLARVFLHDAPFVLLDEPTSNLDSLNEAAVLRALSGARAGKTIVLVSHRASTAMLADTAYTVESGRVS